MHFLIISSELLKSNLHVSAEFKKIITKPTSSCTLGRMNGQLGPSF